LKSKQKYGIRGGGKRMTKKVKSYLEGYFLSGNVNKSDRMTAREMVSELQNLAEEDEIQVKDIPEVVTVANWITRYAASLKKLLAQQLEESNSLRNFKNNQGNLTITDINEGEEIIGSNEEESSIHGKKQKTALDTNNTNEHFTKRHKKS
jgi:hypothetical protein